MCSGRVPAFNTELQSAHAFFINAIGISEAELHLADGLVRSGFIRATRPPPLTVEIEETHGGKKSLGGLSFQSQRRISG